MYPVPEDTRDRNLIRRASDQYCFERIKFSSKMIHDGLHTFQKPLRVESSDPMLKR